MSEKKENIESSLTLAIKEDDIKKVKQIIKDSPPNGQTIDVCHLIWAIILKHNDIANFLHEKLKQYPFCDDSHLICHAFDLAVISGNYEMAKKVYDGCGLCSNGYVVSRLFGNSNLAIFIEHKIFEIGIYKYIYPKVKNFEDLLFMSFDKLLLRHDIKKFEDDDGDDIWGESLGGFIDEYLKYVFYNGVRLWTYDINETMMSDIILHIISNTDDPLVGLVLLDPASSLYKDKNVALEILKRFPVLEKFIQIPGSLFFNCLSYSSFSDQKNTDVLKYCLKWKKKIEDYYKDRYGDLLTGEASLLQKIGYDIKSK